MTDNKSRLTFSDLAKRPRTPVQTSSILWDKAFKIMGTHPKCLKRELFNGTWYLVSPSQSYSHRGESISYAIARPEMLGADTDMLFVVPNGDFGKLVLINRYGEIPLTVYRPDDVNAPLEEVDSTGFDAILGSLLTNVERIAEHDRSKYKRMAVDLAQRAKRKLQDVDPEVAALGIVVALLVLVVGGAIWAAAVSIESLDDKAAKFDAANPGLVIQGTEVHLDESKTLDPFAPDMDKGLPWSPSSDVEMQPRMFEVDADSCATGSTVEEFGYIKGNQHLIAASDAPKGTIRVDVAMDGLVTVCANDLENRGASGQDVPVLLQVLNN